MELDVHLSESQAIMTVHHLNLKTIDFSKVKTLSAQTVHGPKMSNIDQPCANYRDTVHLQKALAEGFEERAV